MFCGRTTGCRDGRGRRDGRKRRKRRIGRFQRCFGHRRFRWRRRNGRRFRGRIHRRTRRGRQRWQLGRTERFRSALQGGRRRWMRVSRRSTSEERGMVRVAHVVGSDAGSTSAQPKKSLRGNHRSRRGHRRGKRGATTEVAEVTEEGLMVLAALAKRSPAASTSAVVGEIFGEDPIPITFCAPCVLCGSLFSAHHPRHLLSPLCSLWFSVLCPPSPPPSVPPCVFCGSPLSRAGEGFEG